MDPREEAGRAEDPGQVRDGRLEDNRQDPVAWRQCHSGFSSGSREICEIRRKERGGKE